MPRPKAQSGTKKAHAQHLAEGRLTIMLRVKGQIGVGRAGQYARMNGSESIIEQLVNFQSCQLSTLKSLK